MAPELYVTTSEESTEGRTGIDLPAFSPPSPPQHQGLFVLTSPLPHCEHGPSSWALYFVGCFLTLPCMCLCCEQTVSSQCVPAAVASLLMPSVVFTQSTCAPLRETDNGLMALGGQELPGASSSFLLPLQNWDSSTMASRPLTRLQLQEALLNLIQVRLLT